jgi:hypothetical protein
MVLSFVQHYKASTARAIGVTIRFSVKLFVPKSTTKKPESEESVEQEAGKGDRLGRNQRGVESLGLKTPFKKSLAIRQPDTLPRPLLPALMCYYHLL